MHRWRLMLAGLILLVVLGQPVLMRSPRGDRIVFGRDLTLGTGEQVAGDLIVFGGDATLEPRSLVGGDVVVFGGSLQIDGLVGGNVLAPGGNAKLGADAVVKGNVLALGQVSRESPASIGGQSLAGTQGSVGLPFVRHWGGHWLLWPPGLWFGWPWGLGLVDNPFVWAAQVLLGGLLVIALGLLVAFLTPKPVGLAAATLQRTPWRSLLTGLAVAPAAGLAGAVLIFTCIGIPVALVGALLVGVALVVGWVAVGLTLGRWLFRALNGRPRLPWAPAAAGLAVLALLVGVPYLQVPVALLVSSWGLGAMTLTRFGSVSYPRTTVEVDSVTGEPADAAGEH